uniref:tRNA (guanine(10)-N(2))-methyltransferase TRMT11 n=1 Tax=Poecilia latipinna TaxID=48699 RepID=A0A3B3VQL6_9TELE
MAASGSKSCLQYLFHLAHDHLDFRLPVTIKLFPYCLFSFRYLLQSPFWCLDCLSEEDVCTVMARSVCAKSAFELWGHGQTHSELRTSLLNYPPEKMVIRTCRKALLLKRLILKNPQHIFCLLEDYGTDPNNIPEHPKYIYFGRWIADGQRELIRSYSVKNRHFIGNTSMDAGLSFIMANHAKAKDNDLVFDPFVGTGSLLVACSHFGAYVCGTDIDYNTIHGKGRSSRKNQKWRGPDENIRANLRQYGKEDMYVDVMVSDASKPVWRKAALFDAIVTDPPYGIRESTRRTVALKCYYTRNKLTLTYYDIFTDLLSFAAHHLVLGGRLVYWLPVHRPEYCEEMVPVHPCLLLISNCEQTLSSHTSRRLITMEKIKEPEELDSLAHLSDPRFIPYQGHNAFREKYFSGLNKRSAKDDTKSDVSGK